MAIGRSLTLSHHPYICSGPLASKWIAEHLADILDQVVTFNPETLRDACLEADAQLLKELPEADIHGSTAVFAVVTKEEGSVKDEGESDEDDGSGESEKQVSWLVQCCNLGDSRLLLANYETGEVIQVSQDHKPTVRSVFISAHVLSHPSFFLKI